MTVLNTYDTSSSIIFFPNSPIFISGVYKASHVKLHIPRSIYWLIGILILLILEVISLIMLSNSCIHFSGFSIPFVFINSCISILGTHYAEQAYIYIPYRLVTIYGLPDIVFLHLLFWHTIFLPGVQFFRCFSNSIILTLELQSRCMIKSS